MTANPDDLIHVLRLRIGLHLLECGGRAIFPDVAKALGLHSAMLSYHARRLERAGLISCRKSFRARLPVTTFVLTDAGRAALLAHRAMLAAVVIPNHEGCAA